MRKQINIQLSRMLIVLAAIAVLAGWNHEFIWLGISSNAYLNSTIIAVFLFGVSLSFRDVFLLRNEENAFNSLKEAYEDIQQDGERGASDPYWRHHRCLKPAVIVERPRILGHIYDLVYEELMRTRRLQLSVSTMQQLISGIATRLSDDRSLLQYVTGVLVFLGLIGTFIGLMTMVGSVGTIIGGLAGGTGGGDVDFSRLINELQAPLVGMATGFSSSLFGLFTSLALGLIARFSSNASNTLKVHFESWLASVSQIETTDDGENALAGDNAIAPAGIAKLAGSMTGVTKTFRRLHRDLAASAGDFAEMAKGQNRQTNYMQRSVRHLQSIADAQLNLDRKLTATLNRMTDALCQFEERSRQQTDSLLENNAQTAARMEDALARLIDIMERGPGANQEQESEMARGLENLQTTLQEAFQPREGAASEAASASRTDDEFPGPERRSPDSPMRERTPQSVAAEDMIEDEALLDADALPAAAGERN
ncbi:hypothetical protein ACKTEK_15925 [Tepidamorphus sp. 3E244]|uniref:hypothetical protein n=1 Tax=Tepidamorphus sp. 3E244 TaxID=3385498 RepID=UPI0038FCE58B